MKKASFIIIIMLVSSTLALIYVYRSVGGEVDVSNFGVVRRYGIKDDTLYYIDAKMDSKIFRLMNGEKEQITEDGALNLWINKNQLFYINMDDGYHIHVIDLDTMASRAITKYSVKKFAIWEDALYFIAVGYQENLCKMDLNGHDVERIIEKVCIDFSIEDEGIYYSYELKDEYRGYKFNQCDINGDNDRELLNDFVQDVDYDDMYFYHNNNDGIFKTHRQDGTKEMIVNENVFSFKVVNEHLYFVGKWFILHRSDISGNNIERLIEVPIPQVDVIDNWVIYFNMLGGGSMFESSKHHKFEKELTQIVDEVHK